MIRGIIKSKRPPMLRIRTRQIFTNLQRWYLHNLPVQCEEQYRSVEPPADWGSHPWADPHPRAHSGTEPPCMAGAHPADQWLHNREQLYTENNKLNKKIIITPQNLGKGSKSRWNFSFCWRRCCSHQTAGFNVWILVRKFPIGQNKNHLCIKVSYWSPYSWNWLF